MADRMETGEIQLEKSDQFGYTSLTRVGASRLVYPPDPIAPPGRVAIPNRPGTMVDPVEIGYHEDVKMIRWIWTEVEDVLYVSGFIKVMKWNE